MFSIFLVEVVNKNAYCDKLVNGGQLGYCEHFVPESFVQCFASCSWEPGKFVYSLYHQFIFLPNPYRDNSTAYCVYDYSRLVPFDFHTVFSV